MGEHVARMRNERDREIRTECFPKYLKGRDRLEDLSMDGRVILKLILNK
jgi:hypothetical protein